MQSFFEKHSIALDTSQPSIRHLQDLIRHRTPVAIQVVGIGELEGTLHWQDGSYLALSQAEGAAPDPDLSLGCQHDPGPGLRNLLLLGCGTINAPILAWLP